MKCFVLFLFLLSILTTFGQDSLSRNQEKSESFLTLQSNAFVPRKKPFQPQHNSIYVELAGSGGFASFNYEHNFYNTERLRWMFRAGISGTYIDKNNGAGLIFPVMVHTILGTKHGLDVGIGQAFTVTTRGSVFLRTPLSIGYRFEPPGKRLFYRIAYTPIISYLVDFQWQHWGGISIGYKLRTKFKSK